MRPYYDDGRGLVIFHGDCREVMPTLGLVDAVITDQPYGIGDGAAFVRRGGAEIADYGDAHFNEAVPGWLSLAVDRVIEGGYLASFVDRKQRGDFEAEMKRCGLTPWMPFYLVKSCPAPTPRPVFMSAVEEAAIGYKGTRRWFGGGGLRRTAGSAGRRTA